MPVGRVYLKNFRNFTEADLNFSYKNTIVLGKNGSGKTSLIEALNLLLSGKSLRTSDLKECIKDVKNGFQLYLEGKANKEDLKIKSEKLRNKRITIQRKIGNSPVKKENVPMGQLILAQDLRMLEGEPDIRRNFFNSNMFHVEQNSLVSHNLYKKSLVQRNMSLKRKSSKEELNIWTEKLIEEGEVLAQKQRSFFEKVKGVIIELRSEADKNKELYFLENLNVSFQKGWPDSTSLRDAYSNLIVRDRALGYSSAGPHRFDIRFGIGNKLAKSILSRGQQKLLILLIFFRLEEIIIENHREGVIYLIDDLTAELDDVNLPYALKEIKKLKSQSIVTVISGKNIAKSSPLFKEFKQINL